MFCWQKCILSTSLYSMFKEFSKKQIMIHCKSDINIYWSQFPYSYSSSSTSMVNTVGPTSSLSSDVHVGVTLLHVWPMHFVNIEVQNMLRFLHLHDIVHNCAFSYKPEMSMWIFVIVLCQCVFALCFKGSISKSVDKANKVFTEAHGFT